MVWLSICSILSSHSCVSIMYHVLARTSQKMGATAWSGSQSVQYYPHIHECPSCFMSSLVRHKRWELQHGLALNLFNTLLTFMSVHRISCPRSYVTKDGSYNMVWLSICSILSSHSCVSIMYHVLARTSQKMGATAWSGSQSVQYYPHIHECPSCFMSSLVRHERWELQHGLALF